MDWKRDRGCLSWQRGSDTLWRLVDWVLKVPRIDFETSRAMMPIVETTTRQYTLLRLQDCLF